MSRESRRSVLDLPPSPPEPKATPPESAQRTPPPEGAQRPTPPEAKPAPPTPYHPRHAVDFRVGLYVPGMGRHGRCERRRVGRYRRGSRASVVDAEVQLNRNRVRRTGAMMAMASFVLVMLAACAAGGAE